MCVLFFFRLGLLVSCIVGVVCFCWCLLGLVLFVVAYPCGVRVVSCVSCAIVRCMLLFVAVCMCALSLLVVGGRLWFVV